MDDCPVLKSDRDAAEVLTLRAKNAALRVENLHLKENVAHYASLAYSHGAAVSQQRLAELERAVREAG